ncbi:MAG TPA: DUF4126 family protein [Acidobacteriaceae bacterium]|nr:DUF4126 family protein [Acidobacteriaceae bacterium]
MGEILALTFLIDVVAGLRALTPLAAVAWGARLNEWPLIGTHLAWMGNAIMPWVFSVLALGELINDKLPTTPSRKIPPQFIARVVSGALCGAVIGAAEDSLVVGLIAGAVGAVVGTLGGAAVRTKLAAAIRNDLIAALIEDVVAIGLAIAVVAQI